MTSQTGDLGARLSTWLSGRSYEIIEGGGAALVVEPERTGEAEVSCPIPPDTRCLVWKLSEISCSFLQQNKQADGALLLCLPDGRFEAHIIECKRTVDQTKWRNINEQFLWTLGKLLAVTGVLGVTLDRVVFGTAFRNDRLSEDESPNPAEGMPLLGEANDDEERQQDRARRQQLAWMNDEVRLRGFSQPFQHTRIALHQEDGRGTYVPIAAGSRR